MRATRAYIASAGTAVVMLGASVCVFALVSGFIAFGSWPGAAAHTSVDKLVLRDVKRHTQATFTVRPNAVAIARRAANRSAPTLAAGPPRTGVRALAVPPTRSGQSPGGQSPAGGTTRLPSAPAAPSAPAPGEVAAGVGKTTTQLAQTVLHQAAPVTRQVNQVIQQVTGPPPPPPPPTGTNPAGSVLGH